MPSTRTLLAVPPDTAFASAVRNRVAGMPALLRDHSIRTWRLAAAIARVNGWQVDEEVLYAGALLHDLGLAEPPAGDVQFEVHGAEAARNLALDHGMGKRRADNAWDVVALHPGGLADFKSAETAAVGRAVTADVTGRGLEGLPADLLADLFATRRGFAGPFFDSLVEYAAGHPGGSVFTWLHPVAARHLAGFPSPDLRAMALAHPYE